mmetsp:Transcript_44500/g.123167  ORF Transcript_44500/g.123167 Transcript_44500/m.123167 type:complete len:293 (-) Transcript_44500:212-1090(-)
MVEGAMALAAADDRIKTTAPKVATARRLDTLEARLDTIATLFAQNAADIRSANKFADFAEKDLTSRIDVVEKRHARLEEQVLELVGRVDNLCVVGGHSGGASAALGCEASSMTPAARSPDVGADDCARENLRQHQLELECLERRLAAIEDHALDMHADGAADSSGAMQMGTAEEAMLAMQELEMFVRSEMKAAQRRADSFQDALDNGAMLLLRDLEQRFEQQASELRHLSSADQDVTARVEEHEVRMGLLRTKLEVHDDKIACLEETRWTKGLTRCGGNDRDASTIAESSFS